MNNLRALKVLAPDRLSISVIHRLGEQYEFGIVEQRGFEIDLESDEYSSLSEEEILQRMFLIERSKGGNLDLIISGYSMVFLPFLVRERVLKYSLKITNFHLLGSLDERRSETRIFVDKEEWDLDRMLYLTASPYRDYIGLPAPIEFSFFPDYEIHQGLDQFVKSSLLTFSV
jgi:hypothetical protein